MVRREVLERIGGFEEAFHGMYEDQVFYAKVSLTESIFVSGECLDQYRQHPESLSTIAVNEGRGQSTRTIFLNWLMSYLLKNNVEDPEIWLALRRESWLNQQANTALLGRRLSLLRWMKKWTLRTEEWIVPTSIRTRYRTR
jgi:hypothetical protein